MAEPGTEAAARRPSLLENTRSSVREAVETVQDRAATVRSGKALFDSGEATRTFVGVKGGSIDAWMEDQQMIQKMLTAASALNSSAAELRKVAGEPNVDGIDKANFLQLADEYEAKAKVHTESARLLQDAAAIEPPTITREEQDCLMLMKTADTVHTTASASVGWMKEMVSFLKGAPRQVRQSLRRDRNSAGSAQGTVRERRGTANAAGAPQPVSQAFLARIQTTEVVGDDDDFEAPAPASNAM